MVAIFRFDHMIGENRQLHPIKLSKPTNQTSEYIIKRAFQQAAEVKCRKKFILAQVYDIIAYLALLQSSAIYEHCEMNA